MTWKDLPAKATFPTVLRHKGSAGTYRPSIDHHCQAAETQRRSGRPRRQPATEATAPINRARRRAPKFSALECLLCLWSLFLSPRHIRRAGVIIRPLTLLKFHNLLKQRKYRLLYASGRKCKPGPKGPSSELIQAIVELKHIPRFGCPRIAQQINKAFGFTIDKDVVRHVLAAHYGPDPNSGGRSWLTFRGHTKDSIRSVHLFRCKSTLLKTH